MRLTLSLVLYDAHSDHLSKSIVQDLVYCLLINDSRKKFIEVQLLFINPMNAPLFDLISNMISKLILKFN